MSLTTDDLQAIKGVVIDVIAPWMEHVEVRFDGIETTQEQHTAILNQHSTQITDMQQTLDTHTRQLDMHTRQLDIHTKQLENIDGRLEAVENDVKDIYRLKLPHTT